jgi:hypothetical protein
LTLQERVDLSLLAVRFFFPGAYRDMCAAIGRTPHEGVVEPLSGWEFLNYIEKGGQLAEPSQCLYRIRELLFQLAHANVLSEIEGRGALLGRHYYFDRELTALEEQGVLWLAPALGAEFIVKMFSTVTVQITGKNASGDVCAGTGLVIDPHWLLTCAHVVKEMVVDEVQSIAGRRVTVGRTEAHQDVDIGLVQVSPGLPCLPGLAFRDPSLAETVFTVGYPRIPLSREPALIMQRGEITNPDVTTLSGRRLFLYSAIARPGNSGGPVIASTGQVVGVVTEELSEGGDKSRIPFHAGISTAEIVRAVAELDPSIRLPIEEYR